MHRFFLPGPYNTPAAHLDGEEAHHLLGVLRASVGAELVIFDGRGTEATARIVHIGKNAADLEILERRQSPPDTVVPVTLGTAVPKGERFDWLVEKATELGVTRLIPLLTAHRVVEPGANKLNRLRRTIISASKQCGRNRLMELGEPTPWHAFVEREFRDAAVLVAHPGGESLASLALPMNQPLVLAVGPEGGLTDEEIDLARRSGGRIVGLGPRLLRVETAAMVLATMCCLR